MSDMKSFIGLSAILTGFDSSILAPEIDPIDIKSVYINVWVNNIAIESKQAHLTADILSAYVALSNKKPALNDQEIGEKLLSGNAMQEMACRKLIYLWYMGAWPTVMSDPENKETKGSTSFSMVSSKSYTAGLVWQVMQAHPMGHSNERYGYWDKNQSPVELKDYTGHGE